ncbi:MAG: hypothetical protein V4719_15535 [Planctomycetota bacterium]
MRIGLGNSMMERMVALLVTFALAAGCQSKPVEKPAGVPAQVSGTVSYAGKPIARGSIILYPQVGGPMYQAPLGAGGAFKMASPTPTGKYVVYLYNGTQPLSGVPQKYSSETSSDYIVTIQEGENTLAVDLK